MSSQFSLEREARQGCPLSPGLFTLSLEPLVQAVRQILFITPIHIKDSVHHISLNADDILLYLSDYHNSAQHALTLFNKFGSFLYVSVEVANMGYVLHKSRILVCCICVCFSFPF